jgi:hypothetical protein
VRPLTRTATSLTAGRPQAIIHHLMNYGQPPGARRLPLTLGATTLFEGLRAGAGTFRLLLDLPARHDVGPVAFATFSRATDLSVRGIAFYSLFGFGGALLTGLAWLAARRAKAERVIRLLLGCAFISSLLVLVLTTQAAPLMWAVGRTRDSALVGDLLDRFTLWTTLRVGLVDLSFLAVLATLVTLAAKNSSAARQSLGTATAWPNPEPR